MMRYGDIKSQSQTSAEHVAAAIPVMSTALYRREVPQLLRISD
jgi:hypothetical protein